MRWFVEISPLGASKGQKQKWCLEAAGWQPALKEARRIRGEEGPLGGFSIELLDDGARAADPATRLRYVIRSAPDDAPLTHTKDGPVPGVATKSEPPKSAAPKVEPAKPEPAKAEPAKVEAPKAEPAKAAEPEPSDDVDIPVDEEEESAGAASLPAFQVLQSREENPTAQSPLTYREHVYAVAPETSDDDIERLLLARFETVQQGLAGKTGRFVNLAIFDHVFTGKPSRKPRATLAWKDWRGAPEIRVGGAERPSLGPPSFSAPTSLSRPVPQPSTRPQESQPASAVAATEPVPTPIASTEPAPVVAPAASAKAAPVVAPVAAAEPAPVVEPQRLTEPSAAPVPPRTEAAAKPETPAKTEAIAKVEPAKSEAIAKVEPAKSEPPARSDAPKKSDAPAKSEAPKKSDAPAKSGASKKAEAPASPKIEAAPAASARSSVPVSAAPKTMPAAAPARREAFIPPVKTKAEAGKRVAGDELIAELFEACGDLQFLRDSLEGAEFILSLALEKLPSEVGLLSLFDMNRREFVVVRQAGGARSIVLSRLPERAGLAQPAMRKRSAIVVADAAKEPRALDDRARGLGIELKSIMVAPVEQSGRYLGLIELWNPIDGRAFSESDGNALTYISEQYAEFVAERGVLTDPDTVLERHQKH